MGIDIYMRWDGQTEEEKKAQYTGFSIQHGHVGYLREAYHGQPYATRVLVPEAFSDDAPEDGVEIPASVLEERLPLAMQTAIQREKQLYNGTEEEALLRAKSFSDFVDLAKRKETETKKPVRIEASC